MANRDDFCDAIGEMEQEGFTFDCNQFSRAEDFWAEAMEDTGEDVGYTTDVMIEWIAAGMPD